MRRQEEPEVSVAEKLKREKAIEGIESDSFVQQDFRSSYKVNSANGKDDNSAFDFGTSAEKTSKSEAEVKMDKLNKQGLFHPSLFGDQKKREERFLKNLFEIRQQALKTMK